MKIIKTEKAFGIAGKAWAAINEKGEVVEIISMAGGAYYPSMAETMESAGKKRWCPAADREHKRLQSKYFSEYRTESREKLAKLGAIVSGVACCGEFCY